MVNNSSTSSLNALENKLQEAISAGDYDGALGIVKEGFQGEELDEHCQDQKLALLDIIYKAVKQGKFHVPSPEDEALDTLLEQKEQKIWQELQEIKQQEQDIQKRETHIQALEQQLEALKQEYDLQDQEDEKRKQEIEQRLQELEQREEKDIKESTGERQVEASSPDIAQNAGKEEDPFNATELWSDRFTNSQNRPETVQYEYNESGFLVEKQVGSFTDRVSQGRNAPSSMNRQ